MSYLLETLTVSNDHRLAMYVDDDARENPRTESGQVFGHMFYEQRHDERNHTHPDGEPAPLADVYRELNRRHRTGALTMLERYLRITTGRGVAVVVPSRDRGTAGFIAYIDAEGIEAEGMGDYTDDQLREALRAHGDEYAAWAAGHIYGIAVQRRDRTVTYGPDGTVVTEGTTWTTVEDVRGLIGYDTTDLTAVAAAAGIEVPTTCRHCGGSIYTDPENGWMHTESEGVACGLPVNTGNDDTRHAEPATN